jgi:hypothetical protein
MKFSTLIATTFLLGSISLGSAAWAADAVRYSGFVDHYPELKLDPHGGGGMLYTKPGVDLGSYKKIMIEPIEVWMADDSKYKGFSPDDLKAITDEFYRVLLTNLEPDYPVVSQPGKGVLVVRLAITDVYAKKKKRGLLGYTPIGAVAGAATGAYRKVALKDATIEAELLDATISKSLDYYAKRLRSRLDE